MILRPILKSCDYITTAVGSWMALFNGIPFTIEMITASSGAQIRDR